jgi:hypothetical protein
MYAWHWRQASDPSMTKKPPWPLFLRKMELDSTAADWLLDKDDGEGNISMAHI